MENNRLIAKFMGMTETQDKHWYHKSWDWLMPVLIKIRNMGYEVRIDMWECDHDWISGCAIYLKNTCNKAFSKDNIVWNNQLGDNELETVYMTIIDFINWYNKEHKTPEV